MYNDITVNGSVFYSMVKVSIRQFLRRKKYKDIFKCTAYDSSKWIYVQCIHNTDILWTYDGSKLTVVEVDQISKIIMNEIRGLQRNLDRLLTDDYLLEMKLRMVTNKI